MNSERSETGRVCPNCGAVRDPSRFRSPHPRTHCDDCHEAKRVAKEEQESLPSLPGGDGVNAARLRRLERYHGENCPSECPVLGLKLDAGPRSAPEVRPADISPPGHDEHVVSQRAAELLAFDPVDLRRAAAFLEGR